MTRNKLRQLVAATTLTAAALAAGTAWAASWVRTGTVSMVNLKDNANDSQGTGRELEITFHSGHSGSFCGSSSATISIYQSGNALWSEWIRLATAAQLSGKSLRVGSNNNTGSCKPHYLRLQD